MKGIAAELWDRYESERANALTSETIATDRMWLNIHALSNLDAASGSATVLVHAISKRGDGPSHLITLSPMQAIHLATELLGAVKELKLFEVPASQSGLRKHLDEIDREQREDYRPSEFHAAVDLLR